MVVTFAIDLADYFKGSTIDGWDVVIAVVVVIVAWIASIIAARGVRGFAHRLDGISPDLAAMGARIVKYFVLLIGIGVALTFLGASMQPLLAAAIIAAVVMFLTLRSVADNFGASVLLQTTRPFVVDDEVELMGYNGIVKDVNGRTVVLHTFDGRVVHLPNSELLDHPIVNNSNNRARRSEVEIRVATAPGPAITDTIRDAVASADGVLPDPPPIIAVRAFENERTTLLAQFWHDASKGLATIGAVVESVGAAIGADGTVVSVLSPSGGGSRRTPPPA